MRNFKSYADYVMEIALEQGVENPWVLDAALVLASGYTWTETDAIPKGMDPVDAAILASNIALEAQNRRAFAEMDAKYGTDEWTTEDVVRVLQNHRDKTTGKN